MARRPRPPVIEPDLLETQEREAIRERARKRAQQELKQKQEDAYFEQVLAEERGKLDPAQEQKTITLDLAGHSDRIMLDGTIYFHGQTYTVSKALHDTLLDIMARGWEHEAEVGGVNRDRYRPSFNAALRPGDESSVVSRMVGSL